jgi:hypothetical protein
VRLRRYSQDGFERKTGGIPAMAQGELTGYDENDYEV